MAALRKLNSERHGCHKERKKKGRKKEEKRKKGEKKGEGKKKEKGWEGFWWKKQKNEARERERETRVRSIVVGKRKGR